MLDVNTLETQELELLTGYFEHARLVFGENLLDASTRKLKRAKKHLRKVFSSQISRMSQQVQQYFTSDASERALFQLLQACYQVYMQQNEARWEAEKVVLASFGEAVYQAIQRAKEAYDEDDVLLTIRQEQCQTWMLVEENEAFSCSLVLENAILSPQVAQRGYIWSLYEVRREGDWVIFYEREEMRPQEAVRFTDAKVHIENYDCTKRLTPHGSLAWALYNMAYQIIWKSEISADACNEREKALLPLLREIKRLDALQEHPNLRQLAKQVGCNMSALDEMLKKKKRSYPWDSFFANAEYEPLLRAIFEEIRHSQEGYPSQVGLRCDPQTVAKKRAAVTEFLRSHGFAGEYPDFNKTVDIPGYHMVPGQRGKVLYCRVKNAQMFIRCVEGWAGEGEMLINFLCGRALTGKRQPVRDILSCYCQDRGYRWSGMVWDHTSARSGKDGTLEAAALAVKKVQMQKLTKEEKKRNGEFNVSMDTGYKIALAMPALTVPATILLVTIILTISGDWAELRKMMMEFPWWEILACYGALYGLPFGVFALIARRR